MNNKKLIFSNNLKCTWYIISDYCTNKLNRDTHEQRRKH